MKKQDFFNYLPPEIITNILLKLPVDSIASSKCVSKPWRDLLDSEYFVKSHLSKSVPFLALITLNLKDLRSSCCQALEFEDEAYDVESPDLRYSQVTKFVFPARATIVASVNGLLLLSKIRSQRDTLFICNPITRCYVEIPGPNPIQGFSRPSPPYRGGGAYGFGVSRISRQFKVVWIGPKLEFDSESNCRVRTLGTRSWRRVAGASLLLKLEDCVFGAFLDGNLHWTVTESSNTDKPLITCFDLETECFSSFGAPASRGGLSVLNDGLCFCEWKDGIVVWLMKEYGVEKSWSKEYVIAESAVENGRGYGDVFPIKVFENGDVLLMLLKGMCLRYYFDKTKTFWDYGISDEECGNAFVSSMLFTPSFQTLESLGMKNVISF